MPASRHSPAPRGPAQALMVGLVTLAAGCPADRPTARISEEPRPAPDAAPPPSVELSWRTALPLLTTVAREPEVYPAAQATWRTATTALSRGELEMAAEKFLEVAASLTLPDDHPHGRSFAAARCMAYQNAAAVWIVLGRPQVAIERLGEKKVADPACTHSIDYALERTIGP